MSSGYDIPTKFAGRVRIGTCSWKYDSWKGLVYDPDRRYRPEDCLPDYARHFTTVEIDQWFWSLFPTGARLPDPDVAKRYADSVPDDFRFTGKVGGLAQALPMADGRDHRQASPDAQRRCGEDSACRCHPTSQNPRTWDEHNRVGRGTRQHVFGRATCEMRYYEEGESTAGSRAHPSRPERENFSHFLLDCPNK